MYLGWGFGMAPIHARFQIEDEELEVPETIFHVKEYVNLKPPTWHWETENYETRQRKQQALKWWSNKRLLHDNTAAEKLKWRLNLSASPDNLVGCMYWLGTWRHSSKGVRSWRPVKTPLYPQVVMYGDLGFCVFYMDFSWMCRWWLICRFGALKLWNLI